MKKQQYWQYAKYANLAVSLGLTMAAAIFLGYWGGSWLDKKLGTAPWLMLLGMLLGVAVGFRGILSEIKALEKDLSGVKISDREDKHKPKP
ncbi:MAG: synthase protein [Clostridia bacterium]|nr:synthase protein [Clostridia bacterium]